ncbi:MAG: hypothetical protein JW743_02020 [Deltaproteobacteria bacterium]|nr:hypothetical protein [Deltaproteobacteria bacterium]MBN2845956.1 hypothetical protein [Deltaproteobacteria bacterium]
MSRLFRCLSIIVIFVVLLFVKGVCAETSIVIAPEKIDFGIMRQSDTAAKSVMITKNGEGTVLWMAAGAPPWLTIDRYYGTVATDHDEVFLVAHPSELTPGQYRSNIIISSSRGTEVIPLAVTVINDREPTVHEKPETIVVEAETTDVQSERKTYLKALGRYSNGSTADITEEVSWISKNKGVADFIDKGILVGISPGNAEVFAKLGNVTSMPLEFQVASLEGPLLKLSKERFDLTHVEEGSYEVLDVKIRNGGKESLEWEAISKSPWLSVHEEAPDEVTIARLKKNEERIAHLIKGTGLGFVAAPESEEMQRGPEGMYLAGSGRGEISIAIDATALKEGRYTGSILVKSNGGDEIITVSVNVVSLKTISVSPSSITIKVGDKRKFRATGVWSDGKRSDLSDEGEGKWIISDPSVGIFVRKNNTFIAKSTGYTEIIKERGSVTSNPARVDVEASTSGPVLMVSPRELDLGKLGPGERSKGIITLRNAGTGELEWSLGERDGKFLSEDRGLAGRIGRNPHYLRIDVESLEEQEVREVSSEKTLYPIKIRIEGGRKTASYKKALPPGDYREALKVKFNGSFRTIFLSFTISSVPSRPVLEVEPHGIDFGDVEAGGSRIRKIELRNSGKNVLAWEARVQGKRKYFSGVPLEKGRYVSFQNIDERNEEAYKAPENIKNDLIVRGAWLTNIEGYPESTEGGESFEYTFRGTGISVFLWKDVYGGVLNASIDGIPVGEVDCISEKRERYEYVVAEGREEGIHRLTLTSRSGSVGLEGVSVISEEFITNKRGWLRIFPEKGTTTNEIDYVNVITETKGLAPGIYCENLLFQSDSGSEIVKVSLEILDSNIFKYIDIYRYSKGGYSALAPRSVFEKNDLLKGYKESGPAFRLFREGTSGTAPFFWWYNPIRKDYFYSTDRNGGGKSLKGYVFGGSIGNIATLRIADSKELYRWFNPGNGTHYYTVDLKGEGYKKKGYQYDGIAGYVR